MRTRASDRAFGPFLGAIALVLASCTGSPVPGTAASRGRAVAPVAEVTAKLDVHHLDGKPTLTAVAREGDPGAALAAVLLLDDAAMGAAPGLAAVLEERLHERSATARVTRGAIVITWDASGSAAAALRDFATSLRQPVGPSSALVRRAAELAGPSVPRALEPAARCSGAPTYADATVADLTKPEGAAAIDAARRAAATSERTSLAIVGSRAVATEAKSALSAEPAWPAGAAVQRSARGDAGVAVLESEGPAASLRREGDGEVVVSVDVPAAVGASSLARRLEEPSDPVVAQLALLAPRFAVVEATGVARAGGVGSCFRIDLRARRPEALDAEAVGRAAQIVATAATDRARDATTGSRAIVTAGDARDAAARAAWWATTSDGTGAGAAFVAVAQRPGKSPRITAEDATRAIAAASAARPRPFERRVRHEPGQGSFVMAVGSPCAASIDTRTLVDSAAVALGLVAAASSRNSDIELVPFLRAEGAGLVARGEARPGENGHALAARVARALGVAMVGRPPAVADVERVRARLVEHAASEWGHPEASEALLHALAPENPMSLAPFGHESALVRAEGGVAASTPTDVLAGPLRIAVLSNVDAAQVDAAAGTIATYLPSGTPKPCPALAAPQTAQRGRVDVRVAGDERFAQLTLGIGPLAPEAAEVALAIVAADGGEIATAAAAHGAIVRPRRMGSHVLVDLRFAPERTEDLVTAVQGALDRVARSEMDEATSRRILAVARARLRTPAAEPVGRVVELWSSGHVGDAGAPDPRTIAPRLGATSWTMVVARPL